MVSKTQVAFVPGRSLHDNVSVCQELLQKYDRKGLLPRCTLKIDIQKAYDTLHWDFLEAKMLGLGYPQRFVE